MTATSFDTVERSSVAPDTAARDRMPGGLALSATLHLGLVALILFGLPSLFHRPPPEETPIAVDLVTIAPETRATHPNPYRPKPEAKPEPPIAAPAPKPEPKPEPRPVQHTPPRSEKADPAAFDRLLKNLEAKHQEKPEPAQFDSLLKNLTRTQTAEAEDTPPARPQPAAGAPPSSQPKAPLGSQLTASEADLIVQQIERCWNVPAGARDAKDLVVEIKAVVNPDGTVRQAAIVDTGRYGSDAFFRAAADSAKRAVLNPQCSPLHVPPDKYEAWRNLDLFFNPKDLL